jgi:acyl-CoA reductase-like NAD-dependent aldehyde dehydrogenase
LNHEFTHTVDGKAVRSRERFEVIDPSLGTAFAYAPDADPQTLNDAVTAARAAFPAWRDSGWEERGRLLCQLASAIRARGDELAELITREQGKPLSESRAELERATANLEGYSRQRIRSQVLRDDSSVHIEQRYHSGGVAGVISAWNVPINLFALRAGPLLQSGSTVIAKPSPYAPLATLRVGELARSIFPGGVLNVIAGRDPLGQWLVEHPDVDRISFTGSVNTGKRVMASAAHTLKRVSLELGGNDAAIVLDDVQVDRVARRLLAAALGNCGQVCMAIKRIYVADRIYESMLEALGSLARAIRIGPGLNPGVQLGPLQNRMQFDIVKSLLDETKALPGVRIVAGGSPVAGPGYFIEPTIVGDIRDDARLVREEQFGPVVPVLRYSDVNDAIRRANATRFGLGASVWSSDLERAAAVAARLDAGTVWVNAHTVLDPDTPFGGWKQSGLGRGNGELGLQNCMESNVLRLSKSQ